MNLMPIRLRKNDVCMIKKPTKGFTYEIGALVLVEKQINDVIVSVIYDGIGWQWFNLEYDELEKIGRL